MTRKLVLAIAAIVAVAAVTAALALAATGGGGDEEPLTGSTLARAAEAALAHTDGGTVTEAEAGDDGAAYSVEIRLDGGRQVEVDLDENFAVTGEETDDDGPGDDEEGDDD